MNEHSRLEEAGFFPVPAALVTFRGADGRPQIMPATWVSAVCTHPLTLSVAFQYHLQPLLLPRSGADFAISLPAEQWRFAPSFLHYLCVEELDLAAAFGLTLTAGVETGVPLVAECPVQVECRRAAVDSRFGRLFLGGEVVAVHTLDHPVSTHPFIRTWRRHLFQLKGEKGRRLPA